DTDNADRTFFAVFAGDRDGCTEIDVVRIARGILDDFGAVDALRQEADPAVDLAKAALAVDVVSVLGAVAVACGPRDGFDELRPLVIPQAAELVVQPLVARRRDVVFESDRLVVVELDAIVVITIGLFCEGFAHGGYGLRIDSPIGMSRACLRFQHSPSGSR